MVVFKLIVSDFVLLIEWYGMWICVLFKVWDVYRDERDLLGRLKFDVLVVGCMEDFWVLWYVLNSDEIKEL